MRGGGRAEPLVVAVGEGNLPVADVAVCDGATIEVEHLGRGALTALATGQGVDPVADPHYVSVFRRDARGQLVSARFRIGGKALAEASSVAVGLPLVAAYGLRGAAAGLLLAKCTEMAWVLWRWRKVRRGGEGRP